MQGFTWSGGGTYQGGREARPDCCVPKGRTTARTVRHGGREDGEERLEGARPAADLCFYGTHH